LVGIVIGTAVGAHVGSSRAAAPPRAGAKPRYLVFVGHLFGAQVVGGSNAQATGTATLVIDQVSQTLTTDAQWSGLTGPADRAHVHSGALGLPRDDYYFQDVGGDDSSTDRTVPCPYPAAYVNCLPESGSLHNVADGSQGSVNCPDFACIVQHAIPDGFFLDFHTYLYESGEIRGQLDLVSQFVANGSFEKPAGAGSREAGADLDGWTIDSGDVDVVANSDGLWQAYAGSQSVDLNGTQPGAVSQTIPTQQGVTYRLSFEMAGNPDCGRAVKKLLISWGGVALGTKKFDTTGHSDASMGWVEQHLFVTGTGGPVKLTFASATSGSCGPVIDAVST
jgi:choice-of-anchor C domain-containing protein